jgi:hypothetical protein
MARPAAQLPKNVSSSLALSFTIPGFIGSPGVMIQTGVDADKGVEAES